MTSNNNKTTGKEKKPIKGLFFELSPEDYQKLENIRADLRLRSLKEAFLFIIEQYIKNKK